LITATMILVIRRWAKVSSDASFITPVQNRNLHPSVYTTRDLISSPQLWWLMDLWRSDGRKNCFSKILVHFYMNEILWRWPGRRCDAGKWALTGGPHVSVTWSHPNIRQRNVLGIFSICVLLPPYRINEQLRISRNKFNYKLAKVPVRCIGRNIYTCTLVQNHLCWHFVSYSWQT
jgi:hypothetical protein